ncbi:J domain-containing protein [Candidatus Nitrosopelagicus sp.]|nr:J domain-containing protein [Candidatus Nitrosopelagicus sp.]
MNKKEKIFYLGIIFAIIIYVTAHVSNGQNSDELKKWSLIGIVIAVLLGFVISSHYASKSRKRCDPFSDSYRKGTYSTSLLDKIYDILRCVRIPRNHKSKEKTYSGDYSQGYTKQKTSEPTYYDILGITKFATEQEIKNAFRKQILKFHSDKNHIDEADEYVKLLYMIRDTLLSSEKRFVYDANRN